MEILEKFRGYYPPKRTKTKRTSERHFQIPEERAIDVEKLPPLIPRLSK